MKNYLVWEGSEIRQQWMDRHIGLELGEQELEILSGLETWFSLPGEEALVPPPKYKMMIIVWMSIFPLSLLLNYRLVPLLTELNIITQIAITTLTLVILMTYFVMPLMAKLFHRWLHCN